MPTVVIRSLLGRVGTVLVGVVLATVTLMSAASRGYAHGLAVLGVSDLILLSVWCLWYAPSVTLADSGLVVRNAWRTHRIAWDSVEGCRTRWVLEVHVTGGGVVTAAAAQRSGGLTISFKRHQELRAREMLGAGQARTVGRALEHRAVRSEFLDPGARTYRVHLDADAAGDLVEAYAVRRADHERTLRHARRREERLARRRATDVAPGSSPEREAGSARAGAEQAAPTPVSSTLNPAPVAALVLCLLALASSWLLA